MNILPSLRLLALLAAAAPLFLLGEWLALGADALILMAAALDAALASRTEVRLEREAPARMSLGDVSEVALAAENRSGRGLRLRLTDDLPAALVREGEATREVRAPAGRIARVAYRLRAEGRGEHALGDLHARVLGPLGLIWHQRRSARREMVEVVPGLREVRRHRLLGLRRRQREPGRRPVRVAAGAGTAFESLRDYVRGDDPRHIDWKATAKRGHSIVREYEAERSQNVVLAIDAGRLMTERVGARARIDYALSAAMLLADVASLNGDRVGAFVFSDRVQRYLPPGRLSRSRLAALFARIEPRLVEPDYPRAFGYLARQLRRRSLLVVFTDIIDADASSALLAHLRAAARRHLPLAVALKNPGLERAAAAPPDDEAAVYRRAAAEELLQQRARALQTMRRSGVLVADVRPEDAITEVVNEYLAVKRKALL